MSKGNKPDDNNWSIHLRARIPASHAGHRGSNPLSTTKADDVSRLFFFALYAYFSFVDVVICITISC